MRIVRVDYISDYKLKLTFGNKKVKIVDLAEKIKNAKGIFLPLKDLTFFKKVTIDDCQLSICWPNGADICPDVLYEMGNDIPTRKVVRKSSEKKSNQKSRRSRTKANLRNI